MTTPNHPIAAEELMAYLDGELPSGQATAATRHLEDCMECQQLAADLRGLSQTVKTWEVSAHEDSPMPPAVAAALDARVAEHTRIPAIPQPWQLRLHNFFCPPSFFNARTLVATAACMVLAFLLGYESTRRAEERTKAKVAHSVPGKYDVLYFSGDELPQTKGEPSVADRRSAQPSGSAGGVIGGQILSRQGAASSDGTPAPSRQTSNALSGTPMVIRTAGLALITKDFDKARTQVEEILRRHHGYVGSLTVTGATGGGRTLIAALRIPSPQLDASIVELKSLGRLDSESQNGEDVTSQYVDLNARLDNSRHTEQRLTDLLQNRTGKLSDVLSVENELARVRGEIEGMEAERKTMANQVDFATLNLTITEDYRAQLQVVPPSTSTRLSNAAVAGYRNLTDGLMSVALFFLESGPTLLLWAAILFFPARFAWKKLHNSFAH